MQVHGMVQWGWGRKRSWTPRVESGMAVANIRHARGEGKESTTRPIISEEAKEEEAAAQAAMDEAEEDMIANVARSRRRGSFAP